MIQIFPKCNYSALIWYNGHFGHPLPCKDCNQSLSDSYGHELWCYRPLKSTSPLPSVSKISMTRCTSGFCCSSGSDINSSTLSEPDPSKSNFLNRFPSLFISSASTTSSAPNFTNVTYFMDLFFFKLDIHSYKRSLVIGWILLHRWGWVTPDTYYIIS